MYPPLAESNLYGKSTFLYITTYLNYLRFRRLKEGSLYDQPDSVVNYKGRTYTITHPFVPMLGASDERLSEYFYGAYLLACLRVGAGQALKDEIAYMNDRFPQSPYCRFINECQDRSSDETERGQKQGQGGSNTLNRYFDKVPPQIIDSSAGITDMRWDNIPALKGKTFFVDIWATWCGPCLAEMKSNFRVDSLLYANHIERLYISLDMPQEKGKWLKLIHDLHLGGYHILAGEKLNRELRNELQGGKDYVSIPRYLIVRDGHVVDSDAPRPSDFETLCAQIQKVCK